jgi:hypothetical protein
MEKENYQAVMPGSLLGTIALKLRLKPTKLPRKTCTISTKPAFELVKASLKTLSQPGEVIQTLLAVLLNHLLELNASPPIVGLRRRGF